MAQEIERKFLVKDDSYKQMASSFSHIVQGYICRTSGRTVRVRMRGDKAFLTIKGPSPDGGLSRYEWEHEISGREALELMSLCESGVIDKVRYLVPWGKHIFEVDEFHGDNTGLLMAEVELSAIDESFIKPSFIGKEVTGDVRYYNSQLMMHPYKEWGE
jgi:CYTH domain-containing protein